MTVDEIVAAIEQRTERIEREDLPVHVILVEDEETGTCQYMRLSPDGHLGTLDA